jgi:predicted RecB family nuclease
MLITADLLLSYQRCDRRAFLDLNGDRALLDPAGDFHLKLQQDRIAHQKTVLSEQIYYQPHYRWGDWQTAVDGTLKLMRQGVERIYKGVLRVDGQIPIADDQLPITNSPTLLSCPDLLIKQPGQSIFGDWMYIPYQIELGRRPKLEYQISVAFHSLILASIQETMPEIAWLYLREKGKYQVNIEKVMPKLEAVMNGLIEMVRSQVEPEVFIARTKCNLCRWYSSCYELAQSQQHLSLLPGVSPSRYSYLRSLNLTTLESLAGANVELLEPYIEKDIATQLVRQAQSVFDDRVILTEDRTFHLHVPTAPIELYFDIEAQPDINLDYLLGVLVVDKPAKIEKFYPFLAEQPEAEELIWQQFLDLVLAYPNAPIFHFCEYEVDTVKRLAKCYKTPLAMVEPILDRFVDIHERVKQAATLPIQSYALKHIARWLGFEWQNPKANGQICIYWYDQWLKESDRAFLDEILRYNEDDCRATYFVKDWLVNLLQDSLKHTA